MKNKQNNEEYLTTTEVTQQLNITTNNNIKYLTIITCNNINIFTTTRKNNKTTTKQQWSNITTPCKNRQRLPPSVTPSPTNGGTKH